VFTRPGSRIINARHQRYHAFGGPQARVSRGPPTPQGGTVIHVPGRRIRHALLLLTPAAAVLLAVPAAPAVAAPTATLQSAPSADLDCTITLTTDIRPGARPQARHQAVTTHGLTGTAVCTGTVDGQPVTGPGRFGNTLQGVTTCAEGSLTGTFVLKIPTAAGEQTITGRFAETVVAPFGAVFTGDLTGTVVSSVLLEGDCVTTPLTRARSVIAVAVTT